MDPDEVDVGTEEVKDETPVSFVESDGETLVTVGEEKKGNREDDERWRRAEEAQNRLATDFADLRVRLAGGSGPPQHGPAAGPDPYRSRLDAITEQEKALGIQWEAHRRAKTLTRDLIDDFDKRARDFNQERTNIAVERAMSSAIPTMVQQTQREQFRAEFGDVQSNPNANRWARGYYDQLVAQGAPDSADTVRQAMNAARAQFRMGPRQAPTDRDRQQYTGFSGNTGRRQVGEKTNVVKMGKAEKSMAMAMYGDRFNGDEKKAYSQWAKGPGVRVQKAAQRARRANAG